MGVYIILGIVAVIVHVIIAIKMAETAENKGYDYDNYKWAGILLGAVVFIMIAALPDKILREKIDLISKELNISNTSSNKKSEPLLTQVPD